LDNYVEKKKRKRWQVVNLYVTYKEGGNMTKGIAKRGKNEREKDLGNARKLQLLTFQNEKRRDGR
jgi:hypothetical protein